MAAVIRVCSLAAVLFSLGCGSDGSVSADPMVRDSLGVTIVENGALDTTRELLATAEPMVQVGVVEGAEELQLFQVSAATRLPDGGFAVTNGGSRELRIYNGDGTHRATAGGAGDGPSEFGYPVGVHVLGGDTIMVQDRVDRVFFNAQGEFLGRTTTDRQEMAELTQRIGGSSEGGQWMPDGSFFAPIYQWDQTPPVAGPHFRPSMTFVRVSSDFELVDTLGVFGGILQQFVDIGEQRPSVTVPPFSRNTSWGLNSSESVVVAADNAVPQVEFFFPEGTHVIARWSETPGAVTGAEVEQWKDRQRDASWAQRRLPQLERAWAAMDIPAEKPYYGRANAGSDGTAWLGPVENQGMGWRAFSPDGRFLGVAGLPGGFFPMDSGPGWVLGVYRDEFEVEYLQLYSLRQ